MAALLRRGIGRVPPAAPVFDGGPCAILARPPCGAVNLETEQAKPSPASVDVFGFVAARHRSALPNGNTAAAVVAVAVPAGEHRASRRWREDNLRRDAAGVGLVFGAVGEADRHQDFAVPTLRLGLRDHGGFLGRALKAVVDEFAAEVAVHRLSPAPGMSREAPGR